MKQLTRWEKFTGAVAKLLVEAACYINVAAVVSLMYEVVNKLEEKA